MSDEIQFEDDDDQGDGSNLVKDLRKQIKAFQKQLQDANTEIEGFRREKRASSISSLLEAKQASPKLAKFVARDLEGDVTEESVASWLEENGELFGWQPQGAVPDDEAQQAALISQATSTTPQGAIMLTPEKLRNASEAQLRTWGIIN